MTLPITVIIPARNDAATLPKAVESALAAQAAEIVVVNDASEDNTISVMQRFVGIGGRVRLLNTPSPVRAGVCFARNLGIHFATQSLVVPLDADDRLLPNSLHALYEAWRPHTFVYGGWVEDEVHLKSAPNIQRLGEKNVAHATFLFAKSDWLAVGGYNPLFEPGCEDWAFMCALHQRGLTAVRLDDALYHKRTRDDGRAAACKARAPLLRDLLASAYPEVFRHAQSSTPLPT
jgi:glycosyltransferase involved in cell wall biosynthesis